MSLKKTVTATAIAISLVITLAVPPCMAETGTYNIHDTSPEKILVDAVILRPAGLVATVIGTAAYILALPAALVTGQTGETAEILIGTPAHYTFTREMGNVDREL